MPDSESTGSFSTGIADQGGGSRGAAFNIAHKPDRGREPIGPSARSDAERLLVVVLVGVCAGVGGRPALPAHWRTEAPFLTGVEQASGACRVLMMTTAGLIVGLGWWGLHSWRTIVTVSDGLNNPDPRQGWASATVHAVCARAELTTRYFNEAFPDNETSKRCT